MPEMDQSRTKSTYGLQWNRYRIIRPEEDRATFHNRTGLEPGDLAGALVLDAGCGMGRYLRIAADSPADLVVGLDLSQAVTAARELTAAMARVAIVRGDFLRLPFRAFQLQSDLFAGRTRSRRPILGELFSSCAALRPAAGLPSGFTRANGPSSNT